jgi:hypothetical protein
MGHVSRPVNNEEQKNFTRIDFQIGRNKSNLHELFWCRFKIRVIRFIRKNLRENFLPILSRSLNTFSKRFSWCFENKIIAFALLYLLRYLYSTKLMNTNTIKVKHNRNKILSIPFLKQYCASNIILHRINYLKP